MSVDMTGAPWDDIASGFLDAKTQRRESVQACAGTASQGLSPWRASFPRSWLRSTLGYVKRICVASPCIRPLPLSCSLANSLADSLAALGAGAG